jgi:amino acid adenylation domain-containing protein
MLNLFDQSCHKYEKQAAIDLNGATLSYGELDRAANRLANLLIDHRVAQDSVVAVLLSDKVEIIITLIALLRSGRVFVPLDVNHPVDRLRGIVSELSPDCFITGLGLEGLAAELCDGMAERRVFTIGGGFKPDARNSLTHIDTRLEEHSDSPPRVVVAPDDMCYIFYTSGSTGAPKGIMGRFESLAHFIKWEIETFDIRKGRRVSQFTPHTHDPFLRDVLAPLCAGGTVCLPPKRPAGMSADELLGWVEEAKLNLIHCVPSLFRVMVGADLRRWGLRSLRHILIAGETLQVADVKKWMAVHGDGVKLVNLYGPTESTLAKFYHVVKEADLVSGFIPIGKPMKGAKAILVDEAGRACARGAPGEIYIRTPYLTLGYYKNPELTAEAFVKNPFSADPNDIIYKTGDLARQLSDGSYQFMGRKDHMVKIRGFRVELGEVESHLRSYDGVTAAAVTVYERSPGESRLAAYVVADEGRAPAVSELRGHLRTRLPEYMIPSYFVFLRELPLTSHGKVDRQKLPPPTSRDAVGTQPAPPRTPVEARLVDIWSQLLGAGEVGVHDNFFDLGGHSLLIPQLTSMIRDAFHVELPLIQLFESPTIAQLAERIIPLLQEDSMTELWEEVFEKYPALLEIIANARRASYGPDAFTKEAATRSPLLRLSPHGSRSPFFCVHPISGGATCYRDLAQSLEADRPFYGLQARGLSGEEEPYDNVVDMAAHYVAAIRSIQPEGPYHLGGWSFGGLVAFETARRLWAEGQSTGVLALIDTRLSTDEERAEADDASLLADLFDSVSGCSVEQLRGLELDEQLKFVLQRLKISELAPQSLGFPWFRAYFKVYRANYLARVRYSPDRYDGPASIFVAGERLAQATHSQALGWERVVAGVIETHVVPGTHSNIINQPYVQVLANRLRTCLERFG